MRKSALIAGAAVAALALTACGGSSDSDTDGITIGIKFDQPGLGLQEADATFSGLDVDVATYIADKLGYSADDITFVESVSAQRETMLENGQVDMILATYSITDARKERVDFGGPYFVAGQDLLVRSDDTEITGPDALDGKNLCSVEGSTSAERIRDDYAEGVELYPAQTYSECVEFLAAGTVDAVTTDDIILAGFAAQEAYAGQFKVVGNTFSEENYGVGLPKDSDQCQAVNDAITEMISDGSWETFIAENAGDAYQFDTSMNPPTPGGHCGG